MKEQESKGLVKTIGHLRFGKVHGLLVKNPVSLGDNPNLLLLQFLSCLLFLLPLHELVIERGIVIFMPVFIVVVYNRDTTKQELINHDVFFLFCNKNTHLHGKQLARKGLFVRYFCHSCLCM